MTKEELKELLKNKTVNVDNVFSKEEKYNILSALEFILNRAGYVDGEPLTDGYEKLSILFED